MPWEVRITNATNSSAPLGSRAEVIAKFAQALPGVDLQPAPGPSAEIIAQMPAILQEHYANQKQQLNADFETEGFSIQFYATDAPFIENVGAEIRGKGNPLAALSVLCSPNGWAVVDASDGKAIDLSTEKSAEWQEFFRWRDKTISIIKSRQNPAE